jgi:hypothetical protein
VDTSPLAEQAVIVWTEVVEEKVTQAVAAAREMVSIDSELQAVSQALVASETRQRTLLQTQEALAEWILQLEVSSPDQTISVLDHWNLIAAVTLAANGDVGWQRVLNQSPELGEQPEVYLTWLTQVNALVEAELNVFPGEIMALQAQYADLASAYEQTANQSSALSANIEVARIKDEAPQVIHLRPTANLMLVGGVLGVLILCFGWFVQITRRTA